MTAPTERLPAEPKTCPYGDPYCPCPDGDACHYEWDYERKTPPMPHPKHQRRRPLGECAYCDIMDAIDKRIDELKGQAR